MSGSAHPDLTQLSDHTDAYSGTDSRPSHDAESGRSWPSIGDLPRLDFLTERDDDTSDWKRALQVDEDDVRELDRPEGFIVDGPLETHTVALVKIDGFWFGACDCPRPDPCPGLCAVHQLTLFDDDLVAEVGGS